MLRCSSHTARFLVATCRIGCGSSTGRLYVGSEGSEGVGSGACFPQSQHGGPGRAGGGAELGGLRGLAPYVQRVALQGHRGLVDDIAGA